MVVTNNRDSTAAKIRILLASMIGTTIEFYDFYIYATAAVLIFPHLFFPHDDPQVAMLQSLATFAVAFLARPLGSALFGHFGDRIGRKATLVAALLTMGVSTVVIGILPTYDSIGVAATLLLVLCRFGQGIGLGGEWSGAVLLALENAPAGKRAWYGMFPQWGAPMGLILANSSFIVLGLVMSETSFMQWGWRIPFLASGLLVILGLYIRLKIHETPAFTQVLQRQEKKRVPLLVVLKEHGKTLFFSILAGVATFVLFYLVIVFSLNWGVGKLGYDRVRFLQMTTLATLVFLLFIPIGAVCAEKFGRRTTSMAVCALVAVFGMLLPLMLVADHLVLVFGFLCLGMAIMGLSYGPIGTVLSEIFPTAVRYTGSALAFNFAGILGASFTPLIATSLANVYGLTAVGGYLMLAAMLSFISFAQLKETKDLDVNNVSKMS